jgi:hypothetical protein
VQSAGLNVMRIEVEPDGKIVVLPGTLSKTFEAEVNEWSSVT